MQKMLLFIICPCRHVVKAIFRRYPYTTAMVFWIFEFIHMRPEWTHLARLLSNYLKQEILKNHSKAHPYAFRLVIFQKPWVSAFWILASPAYFSKKNLIKRKIVNTLETLYFTLKNWKPLPGSTRLTFCENFEHIKRAMPRWSSLWQSVFTGVFYRWRTLKRN